MDKKTLKALKASIVKWDRNAKAKTPRHYLIAVEDCPLCDLFYWRTNCVGCPIFERTGLIRCQNSAYLTAKKNKTNWSKSEDPKDSKKAQAAAHNAAAEEALFLRSLLPEGETV